MNLLPIFLFLTTLSEARIIEPPPPSPHYSLSKMKFLREGKYRAIVSGVLCNACTDLIIKEVSAVEGVKSARFDFEEGFLWIEIAKDGSVRSSKLQRALRNAARAADLGTDYSIAEIRNVQ